MRSIDKPIKPKTAETMLSNSRLGLLILLIAGSRLLFSFLIFPLITSEGHILNTTADDYDKIAHNLVSGHGYTLFPGTAPTMQRLPLYPFFLVPFLLLFGPNLWPVIVAQAFIDGFSCALVYRIAERMYRNRAVSRLAALLFALYPGLLVAAARIATETLYIFLLLLAVFLYISAWQTQAEGHYVVIGTVLGLTALCKSAGLLLPACLGALASSGTSRVSQGAAVLKTTTVLFMGMLAVISPWLVRNYLLVGRFIPTSTIGGTVVYDAYYLARHPWTNRLTSKRSFVDLSKWEQIELLSSRGFQTYNQRYPFWFLQSEDEYKVDQMLYQSIASGLWEAPRIGLRLVLNNALGFWFVAGSRAATLVSIPLQLTLLIAALIGLRRSCLEGVKAAWVLVTVIAYFNLFYTLSLGMVRYALPIMPFVIILAAKGIGDWGLRGKAPQNATTTTASA
jgi:4-amino-4-deoxy-L-arabinose transferase-like glycosyltransferase